LIPPDATCSHSPYFDIILLQTSLDVKSLLSTTVRLSAHGEACCTGTGDYDLTFGVEVGIIISKHFSLAAGDSDDALQEAEARLSEEPGAGKPHAGICAGAVG